MEATYLENQRFSPHKMESVQRARLRFDKVGIISYFVHSINATIFPLHIFWLRPVFPAWDRKCSTGEIEGGEKHSVFNLILVNSFGCGGGSGIINSTGVRCFF